MSFTPVLTLLRAHHFGHDVQTHQQVLQRERFPLQVAGVGDLPVRSGLSKQALEAVPAAPDGVRQDRVEGGAGHRAIAVDLIGMGGSAKPDIGYSFDDHSRYFAAFVDALRLETVTLVGHHWGAALAWEYARRNPARVRGLAFMEGVLPPAFPAGAVTMLAGALQEGGRRPS